MKIKQFEDIESWKKARELVRQIYSEFSPVRDYGFKDQIQRAAVSVMCNIAEGFDRGSNKEFVQFLVISRGSVSEVKSLSYAALDLGYINSSAFAEISERCVTLINLINGFMRYLKNSGRKH